MPMVREDYEFEPVFEGMGGGGHSVIIGPSGTPLATVAGKVLHLAPGHRVQWVKGRKLGPDPAVRSAAYGRKIMGRVLPGREQLGQGPVREPSGYQFDQDDYAIRFNGMGQAHAEPPHILAHGRTFREGRYGNRAGHMRAEPAHLLAPKQPYYVNPKTSSSAFVNLGQPWSEPPHLLNPGGSGAHSGFFTSAGKWAPGPKSSSSAHVLLDGADEESAVF
jgi:hypothetical protein